jgi:hypothetical protein
MRWSVSGCVNGCAGACVSACLRATPGRVVLLPKVSGAPRAAGIKGSLVDRNQTDCPKRIATRAGAACSHAGHANTRGGLNSDAGKTNHSILCPNRASSSREPHFLCVPLRSLACVGPTCGVENVFHAPGSRALRIGKNLRRLGRARHLCRGGPVNSVALIAKGPAVAGFQRGFGKAYPGLGRGHCPRRRCS